MEGLFAGWDHCHHCARHAVLSKLAQHVSSSRLRLVIDGMVTEPSPDRTVQPLSSAVESGGKEASKLSTSAADENQW